MLQQNVHFDNNTHLSRIKPALGQCLWIDRFNSGLLVTHMLSSSFEMIVNTPLAYQQLMTAW